MKIRRLLALISTVALSAGTSQATAQEMQPGIFMVAKGASQKIDRHGVCRTVKNSSGNPIMVPVGTPQQWSNGQGAFLNNSSNMRGVSVSNCAPWYEGRNAVTFTRDFSGTPTLYKWLDGTKTRISDGYGPWIPIPSDLSYDPDTGECSPRKSPIAVLGRVVTFNPHTGAGIYAIQLCDSDGIATSPHY